MVTTITFICFVIIAIILCKLSYVLYMTFSKQDGKVKFANFNFEIIALFCLYCVLVVLQTLDIKMSFFQCQFAISASIVIATVLEILLVFQLVREKPKGTSWLCSLLPIFLVSLPMWYSQNIDNDNFFKVNLVCAAICFGSNFINSNTINISFKNLNKKITIKLIKMQNKYVAFVYIYMLYKNSLSFYYSDREKYNQKYLSYPLFASNRRIVRRTNLKYKQLLQTYFSDKTSRYTEQKKLQEFTKHINSQFRDIGFFCSCMFLIKFKLQFFTKKNLTPYHYGFLCLFVAICSMTIICSALPTVIKSMIVSFPIVAIALIIDSKEQQTTKNKVQLINVNSEMKKY